MPSPLGSKIRDLRRGRNLTLDDLAQATGSSKSYMWEIENKDVARPSGEKLNKIAAALGVTPEYLLDATRTDVTEDVEDVAFYRKYQQLDADAKAKLKRILDVFDQ